MDEKTPLLTHRRPHDPQHTSDPHLSSEVDPPNPLRVRRNINLFSGIMLNCGVMIGAGIFVTPNMVLKVCNSSVGISLIIWLGGGLIAALSSLCYSEMAVSIPQSGSDYSYFNHAYGPSLAFLLPWMSCFLPTFSAVDAVAFAQYALQPFYPSQKTPGNAVKLLSSCMILLVTAINALSVKTTVRVQNVSTAAKFLALGFVVGGGLYYSVRYPSVANETFEAAFDPGPIRGITFGTITNAFYQVMWTYQGWNSLCHVTEEVDRPRTVAVASVLSILIITLCFVVINVAYLLVLTPTEMINSTTVTLSFADKLLGNGSWVISVVICVVTFGSSVANVMIMGRMLHVASRNGHFPCILGMLHMDYLTPLPAICINSLPVIALIWIGEFETLLDALGFVSWIFFALSAAAVLVLRYKFPNLNRPFKIPTFVPILMILIALGFVFLPVISNPQFLYFYALAFFAAGLLLFHIFVRRRKVVPGTDSATKFLQKILYVAPEELHPMGL